MRGGQDNASEQHGEGEGLPRQPPEQPPWRGQTEDPPALLRAWPWWI